jgi:glycerophosphoryl diester phosphodiesterase
VSERAFSQEARNLVVAHRGASVELPENTLAAFQRAVVCGADVVEFDVRLTSDGVPVVLHDPDVGRTTDGAGPVGSLTLAEVKRLRVAGSHEVPTLEETLRLLSGRVGVDVEIKNIPGEPDFTADGEPVVEALVATLERVAFVGPVLVSSFNPASIAHARTLAPEIPTGLLTGPGTEARAALTHAAANDHPWVLPFVDMVQAAGDGFAAESHAAGLRLGTWITDDPVRALSLFDAGVDAVATNDPAPIVAAVREAP